MKKVLEHNKRDFVIALLAIVGFFLFIPVFTYAYFARDLGSKERIMNRNDTGIILLDRKDRPFFSFYEAKYKVFIPLALISTPAQQTIIAGEDKEFYAHPGFSIRGIVRSVIRDLQQKDVAYGGSTITQQLVKNALLTPRKNFLRKYQELILAQEIERRYTKNEILEMYLNSAYFGEGAFGIEEAALTYFGVHAKDLTLAQASYLAGLLPAPSRYSPFVSDGKQAKERQRYVLDQMQEMGHITVQQAQDIFVQELQFAGRKDFLNAKAPHFALLVRKKLVDKYGEEQVSRSGFKVKTTIDLDYQDFAETVVANQVTQLAAQDVTNGAALIMDAKSGALLTMVGSKDWSDNSFGKVNMTLSKRQPGSSFKPLVYIAAFEDNLITPATVLKDERRTFSGNYRPENYDRRFRGNVLVRRSLANSLNVSSVEVMEKVGVPRAIEMAKRLGITELSEDTSDYGLSMVLGTKEVTILDMTTAYSVFANNGVRNDPFIIHEIRDKSGNVVFTHENNVETVIDAGYTFLISSILSDKNIRREVFGNTLDTNTIAAVKTGTTEDYKDAWTMGYTPDIVVGAWVGNNDGKPMERIAGSLGAAPIWKALIDKFAQERGGFIPPANILSLQVCQSNGLVARSATGSAYLEYFVRGTEPTRLCTGGDVPRQSITPQPTRQEQQQATPTVLPTASPVTPSSTVTPTPTVSQQNRSTIEVESKDKKNDKDD